MVQNHHFFGQPLFSNQISRTRFFQPDFLNQISKYCKNQGCRIKGCMQGKNKVKVPFQGSHQPAGSQNSPTKLVVWSLGSQSTVPPLCSSLSHMYTCYSMHNVLKHSYIHVNHDLLMLMYLIEGVSLHRYSVSIIFPSTVVFDLGTVKILLKQKIFLKSNILKSKNYCSNYSAITQ